MSLLLQVLDFVKKKDWMCMMLFGYFLGGGGGVCGVRQAFFFHKGCLQLLELPRLTKGNLWPAWSAWKL